MKSSVSWSCHGRHGWDCWWWLGSPAILYQWPLWIFTSLYIIYIRWLVVEPYPSEKYESQLGWWHSQYCIWKNAKCSKPPTSRKFQEFRDHWNCWCQAFVAPLFSSSLDGLSLQLQGDVLRDVFAKIQSWVLSTQLWIFAKTSLSTSPCSCRLKPSNDEGWTIQFLEGN